MTKGTPGDEVGQSGGFQQILWGHISVQEFWNSWAYNFNSYKDIISKSAIRGSKNFCTDKTFMHVWTNSWPVFTNILYFIIIIIIILF